MVCNCSAKIKFFLCIVYFFVSVVVGFAKRLSYLRSCLSCLLVQRVVPALLQLQVLAAP